MANTRGMSWVFSFRLGCLCFFIWDWLIWMCLMFFGSASLKVCGNGLGRVYQRGFWKQAVLAFFVFLTMMFGGMTIKPHEQRTPHGSRFCKT